MLSLKGILIITSWTICIALTSIYGVYSAGVYSADKKQFEKDNIKQSQSSLITEGSQEVNRFDLHKTEQEMDEDEDDDIISDISNNKQFEKAEFIMERLKELTGETKDERVQDDNINRNDDYDLDEEEVFPDFLNIEELMDESTSKTGTNIKDTEDNPKKCFVELIRSGFSPVTKGINNYIYGFNVYLEAKRLLTNNSFMYLEYLKLEVKSVPVKNSREWCLAEFKNYSEYTRNGGFENPGLLNFLLINEKDRQRRELKKCINTNAQFNMGKLLAIENYCLAYEHTKTDPKKLAIQQLGENTIFPAKYYEYIQTEFSKYNILNSKDWCDNNKPTTKYFSDPSGAYECVVELIKYGLNPINDGLDNYAIVWSKKKTEFFNCTEGHVCNYKKYLTEIVNSWVVVGANKWCIENVHSDSEVSECVASLKKNEMGSESGSENYFNSFLRFFMEATEIPSNLKTYAAKYFAFLHIKSSELKILKTTPWCSGESGYQGFTCIDRLDVHFKQLGRTFLAPILYVRHIIEHMVPKFISDPQVREFIDYLFNSIKDQLGVSMIPLKYCELFDIEVQQKCIDSMNKNGLSLRSIYAAFNRIYYNLSLDTVKEIYIQHYIKYVVMNVLVDDKKLIKGTDAVSWCTFKNNPSMFDNISQNQTKNATETSEKSKEILKDVSKEILKDVSKEILKDASKETPVKKSSVEIPLNLSTEKNTVKDSQEETPLRPSVSEPVISQIKNLSADERKKMYFGSIQKNTPIEPNEDQSKSRFQFLKNPLEIVKEVERKLQQPSKYYSDFMANPIETAKNTFLRFTTFQDDFVNDDKF